MKGAVGVAELRSSSGVRALSRRQVRLLAEPPAVVAARILGPIHVAYRAARAAATSATTAELEIQEDEYRGCYWLLRVDRARYRAVREELRSRGVELPPVPPARRRRLWTTTL